MAIPASDRNLLFGILALQMDFITREQLIEAMGAWVLEKSKPLSAILVERHAMTREDCALLEPLMERHIVRHGNNLEQSLRSLEGITPIARQLRSIDDADVQRSIHAIVDEKATRAHSTDQPAPAGTRFEVVRFHARGGLGEVFIARDKELNRNVALKEIKLDRAYDVESQVRFLLEAEITGGLEHPGIVPVYGLGHYHDGRPFYAMRFIDGDSLYDHIKRFHESQFTGSQRNLALRELLGRFLDVCNAIQYAHDRSVLHRDLKPGNIMLGKHGETLVVDWGLAKLLQSAEQSESGESPLQPLSGSEIPETRLGKGIGTLGYMSPEQAQGQIDKIGTTTDVYSLGATLYCLLTGKSPIGAIGNADPNEVVRSVFTPLKPRVVLPETPAPLESICLKAMSFEPTDRYSNCRELANDIKRWLADEPILVHRESLRLRTWRWIRKHPATSGGLAATILAGLLISSIAAGIVADKNRKLDDKNQQLASLNSQLGQTNLDLKKARDTAIENEQEAHKQSSIADKRRLEAEAQRIEARKERDIALAVRNFLRVDLLQQANPWLRSRSLADASEGLEAKTTPTPTVRELLNRAAAELGTDKLEKKFPGQFEVQIEILKTVADSYLSIREHARAIVLLNRVVALCSQRLGPENPETIIHRIELFSAYFRSNQLPAAIGEFGDVLQIVERKLSAKPKQTSDKSTAEESFAAGLKLLDTALATLEGQIDNLPPPDVLVVDPKQVPVIGFKLAQAAVVADKLSDQIRKRLGPDDPRAQILRFALAFRFEALGQPKKALSEYEDILVKLESRLGKKSAWGIVVRANAARVCRFGNENGRAIAHLETLLAQLNDRLGVGHPQSLATMDQLALVLSESEQVDRAIRLSEETLTKMEKSLGPRHILTLRATNNLARSYYSKKDTKRALPLFERALQNSISEFGATDNDTILAMSDLGVVYATSGETAKAIPLLEQVFEHRKAYLGLKQGPTIGTMNKLADSYRMEKRFDKAAPLYESLWKLRESTTKPDHPATLAAIYFFGVCLRDSGQPEKSLPVFQEAIKRFKAKQGLDGIGTLESIYGYSVSLAKLKRNTEAEEQLQTFIEHGMPLVKDKSPNMKTKLIDTLDWLVKQHEPDKDKTKLERYRLLRKQLGPPSKPAEPKKD